MECPFCNLDNEAGTLVCRSCSRDITIPEALLAERDDLRRKREEARVELASVTRELESLRSAWLRRRREGQR